MDGALIAWGLWLLLITTVVWAAIWWWLPALFRERDRTEDAGPNAGGEGGASERDEGTPHDPGDRGTHEAR
jgi:hypothetical protein